MSTNRQRGDQADGLRRLGRYMPVRVIAVTSGKGGVGKTNVSVNLAVGLAQNGKQTLLLDADLGLADVDVLLGLNPRWNLSHVLAGECTLEEIVVPGPCGLRIIPGASGIKRMAGLSLLEQGGLVRAFNDLSGNLDVLVVDTAAGISDSVVSFVHACHDVLVVVCDEPASITDAYALIKVLSREGCRRFRILANMARTAEGGRSLYGKLRRVSERFLDVSLEYAGYVPNDEYLRRAVQRQQSVLDAYPASRSAVAFKKLAQAADKWPTADGAGGHLQFFFERLLDTQTGEVRTWP